MSLRDRLIMIAVAAAAVPVLSGIAPATPAAPAAEAAATPVATVSESAVAPIGLIASTGFAFDLPGRVMDTRPDSATEAAATAIPTPGAGVLLVLGGMISMRRIALGRGARAARAATIGVAPAALA